MSVELPDGAVWQGNPRFIPFLVPLDELELDPTNARDHTGPRSLDILKSALSEFGQQKLVVLTPDGKVVKAGNGVVMAAREVGWTHLAAVESDLEGEALDAFAIVDNRSPELSFWNDGILAQRLEEFQRQGRDVLSMGWTMDEYESLSHGAVLMLDDPNDAPVGGLASDPQVRGEDASITITVRRSRINEPALKKELEAFCVKFGLSYRIRV